MRFPLLCLLALLVLAPLRAAEPFFRKGDVIALVGGEDMVVASEYGYLELLLTRALPDHHLRFRNLAWEGDTVFEQRRDLNFPTWEEQLDKIGATVVIAQFGQMESLAGKEKLPEFIAAYEKLIERFSGGGKRRIALLAPNHIIWMPYMGKEEKWGTWELVLRDYTQQIESVASKHGARFVAPFERALQTWMIDAPPTRDGFHLTEEDSNMISKETIGGLLNSKLIGIGSYKAGEEDKWVADEKLRQLIIAKNRLWFDYWRPQNWAFLAGDRTAQPSSRDHLDPSKRWFPPEREAFLPLLDAKEKEIDALAQP